GAVVQTTLDEHGGAGLELVDHLLGLRPEERHPVVPGELARLSVVADDVVVTGDVELEDGQPVLRVTHLGRLDERPNHVNGVQSSSHRTLLGSSVSERPALGAGFRRCLDRTLLLLGSLLGLPLRTVLDNEHTHDVIALAQSGFYGLWRRAAKV